jgi:hypothetical protein
VEIYPREMLAQIRCLMRAGPKTKRRNIVANTSWIRAAAKSKGTKNGIDGVLDNRMR